MKKNRRHFLQKISSLTGAIALSPIISNAQIPFEKTIEDKAHLSAEECADDDEFWYQVRQQYTISSNIINLNSGGVSPQPKVVQDAVVRYNQLSNEIPSYYMWRVLDQGKEPLRKKLAELAGCSTEEIAINRNTSEALETIIFGLPLEAGDEVVLTEQDYPNMLHAWRQRAKRDGIVLKFISLKFPTEDQNDIVQQYVNAFTDKTKVAHVTHMINWVGQILPARAIADEAHKRGIEVIVDAAHSFAHIDFKISDLDCDYLGTSLHKWLCAPFGTGMLYIKKEKIKKIYPLFGAQEKLVNNIRKFESLGTRSIGAEQAIGQAIDFHNMIGIERKQKRLQYIKNYWAKEVSKLENITLLTSLDPKNACAIAAFSIKGKKPEKLSGLFLKKYKIHVVPIRIGNVFGVRVSPNVFTIKSELDQFIEAVKEIAKT